MKETMVHAPRHLGAQNRAAFREEALASLAQLGEAPGGKLVVDLSRTDRLDSAGLGTLAMIQQRAAERSCSVTLRGASEEVRFMLLMTRLEERFVIEPSAQA
jgi:anti-anti-sigma factor